MEIKATLLYEILNILFQFTVFVVGIWFTIFIIAIIEAFVAKVFKLRIRSFKIFNRRYTYVEDRMVLYKERFSFFTTCEVGSAPGHQLTKKKDALITCIVILIPSIGFLVATVLFMMSVLSKKEPLFFNPFLGFILGVGLTSAMLIIITIFRFPIGSKKLHSFTNEKVSELRSARTLEEIEMPALNSLADYKKDRHSEIRYQTLFFLVSEMRKDISSMDEVVRWYEDYLQSEQERSLKLLETLAQKAMYKDLIRYYSTWRIDQKKAAEYYKMLPEAELLDDKDANGRRLLAYYSKNILNDFSKAMEYCLEGLHALDDPNTPLAKLEIDNERQLLLDLRANLN